MLSGVALVTGASAIALAADEPPRVPVDDGSAPVAPLPVRVPPDGTLLHYSGRFDSRDRRGMRCAWPASAVTIRFRGTAIDAELGLGANRFEVVVDGAPAKVLRGAGGPGSRGGGDLKLYALASALPDGEHTVTLFKCTEPLVGNALFARFQLNAGAVVLPAATFKRRLEVIGDSISCGYGNEAASRSEPFSPGTENAYWTYGAMAARALGADYTCIAWSGRKMWPNNTIPEIFDRTLPVDATSHWDGDSQPADAILINLSTNDLDAPELPNEARWVKAYCEFVGLLRHGAPEAVIYCAVGPMLTDGDPSRPARTISKDWIREVVKDCTAAGDAKVRYLEFDEQRAENGFGANSHPSIRTHGIMAGKLTEALGADLGWEAGGRR